MSDGLVITKADGENLNRAKQTQVTYQSALHYLSPTTNPWQPQVFTCSAFENTGINEIWNNIEEYRSQMEASGYLEQQRQSQRIEWLDECLKSAVTRYFQQTKQGASDFGALKKQVLNGEMLPNKAAEIVLNELSSGSE
jgi:LAO/AO transport system kinase